AVGFSPDPIAGLYAPTAALPLARAQGIRDLYHWGLYGYCAVLTNSTDPGACSSMSPASRFTPYDALAADMSANYSVFTASLVPSSSPFRDNAGLGQRTHTAYYLILIATILCFLSLLLGLIKRTSTFLLSASLASLASILVLAGTALWSTAISSAQSVNSLSLARSATPLGISVHSGHALSLLWAAFACMTAALIPYWISSCTFRG
ncbi:hypothetical protein K488DRAFT_75412, partial [Vararia minispora EC-137]